MAPMPKKPEKTATTLDDIIADQARQRDEASGVPATKQAASKKPIKAKNKPAMKVSAKSKVVAKPTAKKTSTAPAAEPVGKGRPSTGEVLKNTQFNLPLDLIERLGRVADRLYAGNKSYFARLALEEAVAKAEKKK